ncbi:HAD family phosphatase [uncultured Ruminococcus sp.]|uniref:HAD family hydrolase n=1 Tax=uncultured Ruminococcus sp. TaxID=165186 RepID=UPI0025FCF7C5|nr:HAD family phosphatase [uncultured Ruminococcus sp.]
MDIIFDIGKVLIDFDFQEFVERYVDAEKADRVTKAMWGNPEWVELDRGVLPVEEILQRFIAQAPDCEWEIRRVFSQLGNIPKLRPTTIPIIEELKKRGHRVFYLSNFFEFLLHAAPDALRFTRYTDGGIFSCHEKLVKPDPEIYELLCERYNISKDNCVFIDDSEKNIRGAENVGIRGILFTGQSPDELYEEIGV